MKYIQITNFESFQHYKDRRPTWIKLLIEIIEPYDADGKEKKFFKMTDNAKLTFINLLCLRANYNEVIPYPDDKWLKTRLGQQSISIQPLIDNGFISIRTESVSKPYGNDTEVYENGTPEREKEREKEIEKEGELGQQKTKFIDFVFLTAVEHLKLVEKFGDEKANFWIQKLNNYIGSKGAKYKSHYHTILNWAGKDNETENKTVKPQNNHACYRCGGNIGEDGQVRKVMIWKEGKPWCTLSCYERWRRDGKPNYEARAG